MYHCKLTNLLSENEFGDLDFSQYERRIASVNYHSGIQMVKGNKTISKWLAGKSSAEQSRLLKLARVQLRDSHRESEKAILVNTRKVG